MKPKTFFILVLILAIGAATVANAQTIQKEISQGLSFLFMTQKGEIFSLDIGETQTIHTDTGEITTELLEINYNPDEVSDVHVGEIQASTENPQPGEQFYLEIPLMNEGTGTAHGTFELTFGDESQGGGSSSGAIILLEPGETTTIEIAKTYAEEGYYNIIADAFVLNDIDQSDNIQCKTLKVGNPEGTAVGGCGARGPLVIPKKAHIQYKEYNRRGEIIEQQELWLAPEDIGFPVELIKIGQEKALAVVPR